jgi:hypothetical protein
MADEPDLTLLRKRLAEAEALAKQAPIEGGGGPPHVPPMNPPDERIGRLEGDVSGLKQSQNIMLGGLAVLAGLIAIVVGAVVGFGIYQLQKIDQTGDRIDKVSDRVAELPGKISADLRDITRTLADAITAAKQAPTQVIMVPTPLPPPTPQPRPQQ